MNKEVLLLLLLACPAHAENVPDASATSGPEQACTPKPISNPAAPYPPVSLRRQEEGDVRFHFLIVPDGRVVDVRIVAEPPKELARAAMKTVQQWVFEPFTCSADKGIWMSGSMGFRIPN